MNLWDGKTYVLDSAFLTVLYIGSIKITPGGASTKYRDREYSLASFDSSTEQGSPIFSHCANSSMKTSLQHFYCFRFAAAKNLTERPTRESVTLQFSFSKTANAT